MIMTTEQSTWEFSDTKPVQADTGRIDVYIGYSLDSLHCGGKGTHLGTKGWITVVLMSARAIVTQRSRSVYSYSRNDSDTNQSSFIDWSSV